MNKRICILALAAAAVLTLTACGKGGWNPLQRAAEGAADSPAGVERREEPAGDPSAAPDGEQQTVSGVINRLGEYLVLLTEDERYLIFELGEEVDAGKYEEGDSVTVAYTGELDSEDPSPVAVSITKDG